MRTSKRKAKKKLNIKMYLIAIVIILALGYSFAKYVIEDSSMHIQTAEKFYFTSSMLKENTEEYVLTDWNGKDIYTIAVDLNNYEDNLKYTQENIVYQFNAFSSNSNIAVTNSMSTGDSTLIGGQLSSNEVFVYVEPLATISEGDFVEVEVSATSTLPYEKSISSTFKIYVKELIPYEANLVESENAEYLNLYIKTGADDQNVSLSYDSSKLILDMNNDLFTNATISSSGNISTVILDLAGNSNYNIGFIKKDFGEEIVFGTDVQI